MSAVAVALAGCGTGLAAAGPGQSTGARGHQADCARRSGFALSLVRNRGGAPTPVAAADRWAARGEIPVLPRAGWRLTSEGAGGATIRAQSAVLHAVRGSDGTWQVDSGSVCSAG